MIFKMMIDNLEINRSAVKGGIKPGRPAEIIRINENIEPDFEVFVKDHSWPGLGQVSLGLIDKEVAKEIRHHYPSMPKINAMINNISSDKSYNGTKATFYIEVGHWD